MCRHCKYWKVRGEDKPQKKNEGFCSKHNWYSLEDDRCEDLKIKGE